MRRVRPSADRPNRCTLRRHESIDNRTLEVIGTLASEQKWGPGHLHEPNGNMNAPSNPIRGQTDAPYKSGLTRQAKQSGPFKPLCRPAEPEDLSRHLLRQFSEAPCIDGVHGLRVEARQARWVPFPWQHPFMQSSTLATTTTSLANEQQGSVCGSDDSDKALRQANRTSATSHCAGRRNSRSSWSLR